MKCRAGMKIGAKGELYIKGMWEVERKIDKGDPRALRAFFVDGMVTDSQWRPDQWKKYRRYKLRWLEERRKELASTQCAVTEKGSKKRSASKREAEQKWWSIHRASREFGVHKNNLYYFEKRYGEVLKCIRRMRGEVSTYPCDVFYRLWMMRPGKGFNALRFGMATEVRMRMVVDDYLRRQGERERLS